MRVVAKVIYVSAVAFAATSFAVENKPHAYSTIVERNPFGLKPPTPPPDPAATAKPPEPAKPKFEIFLTGINTYGRKPKAYFYSKEPGLKNPFFSLAEGDADKGLEVKAIDGQERTVLVMQEGKEVRMDFKNNGLKAAVAAPPPVAGKPLPGGNPGVPGQHIGGIPSPTANYSGAAINNAGGAMTPGMTPTSSPYVPNSSLRTVPSRSRGSYTAPTVTPDVNFTTPGNTMIPSPTQQQPVTMSPEEQYLRMRVNEEVARRAGQVLPPLPPVLPQ